jgi:predicted nucleotidyltransferase
MRALAEATLTDAERQAVLEAAQLLRANLPVSRVILFGSKARGDARPDSDIDLLVLTSCPVTQELSDRISDCVAEVNLERDVSLNPLVVHEREWSDGLIRYLLIHSEVDKDGCEV